LLLSADKAVMIRFLRRLKSVVVAPEHLTVLGSLLDFGGPQIGRKFRRLLFRLFGGMFAVSLTGSRYEAILSGLVVAFFSRLETYGLENLPQRGFLLLANHAGHLDPVLLQLACPRPIRFVALESVCRNRWSGPVLKLVGAEVVPVSKVLVRQAVREAAEHIKNGGIVCVFPEGQLSQSGVLLKLQKGFELIGRLADCEVVPAWLDGLYGSIFAFEDGKHAFKFPKRIPTLVTIMFGKPIQARLTDAGAVRNKLLELSEICFRNRPEVGVHLGRTAVASLKRRPFDDAIIDGTDGRRIKRGDLLAAGIALSRWIKEHCPGERVAVLLPPSLGAFVANIAVTLANKVPGNVQFTAGRAALLSAIHRGEISHAISSNSVRQRAEDFPWPQGVYQLEELMKKLKPKIRFWRVVSFLMPARLLADLLGLPRKSDRKAAILFFTSDRSGGPARVVLSDWNVLGQAAQLSSMLKLGSQDSLMASPSLAQGSGCVLTLWYPLIEGIRTVIHPNPNEIAKHAEFIERYAISFLVISPDSVQSYLEQVTIKQLASVKLVIGGPGQLPRGLSEAFEKKFGKPVFDGYWLIETSTLVSTNLPEPVGNPSDCVQPCGRTGSVGKLLPGQAAQIRHPETGEVLSPYDLGILWLKGPSIFQGYLNKLDKTAEVLRNGWFQTGELGRFDHDGFLYLDSQAADFPEAVRPKRAEDRSIACLG
jgi:acyl-[acyl-carrier-protein]-phospholipid O-acyltransferase / long-chain-fatty-acid--[acyl-carrier-protein] ligase